MQLILIRHSLAEAPQPNKEDSLRKLTPDGVKRMQMVADRLSKKVERISVIAHSGYTRALQSAQILGETYPGAKVVQLDAFVPDALPHQALQELRSYGAEITMAVVTHQPFISTFAAFLLPDICSTLRFTPAAFCAIQFADYPTSHTGKILFHQLPD
ncbi:MAG: histidine phosphatase family protein, partial [Bdellovibrionales bacterium]|nr:histidine phosphatase family protein [Bdellovibrionales bacterium]